jgi:hypothetical protein
MYCFAAANSFFIKINNRVMTTINPSQNGTQPAVSENISRQQTNENPSGAPQKQEEVVKITETPEVSEANTPAPEQSTSL